MNTSWRKISIFCIILLAAIVVLPKVFPSLSGNNLVWLIFLLCPLMHIFMMKCMNHGGSGHDDHQAGQGGHSCCGGQKNKPETEETDKK